MYMLDSIFVTHFFKRFYLFYCPEIVYTSGGNTIYNTVRNSCATNQWTKKTGRFLAF